MEDTYSPVCLTQDVTKLFHTPLLTILKVSTTGSGDCKICTLQKQEFCSHSPQLAVNRKGVYVEGFLARTSLRFMHEKEIAKACGLVQEIIGMSAANFITI